MDNQFFKCPLCCNESFDSPQALKTHILDVLSRLVCPICEENVNGLQNFEQHLQDCRTEENSETNSLCETDIKIEGGTVGTDQKENNILVQDNHLIKDGRREGIEYYCEICDVYFSEMKKHLVENHMGEQVAVESQELDDLLKERTVINEDVSESQTEADTNTADTEHIFLEQEILDEEGKFYTKKLTKINIISEQERSPPVLEQIVYRTISSEDTKIESSIKVYRCQECKIRFLQLSVYNKHNCKSRKGVICDICSVYFPNKSGLSLHKKIYHGENTVGDSLMYKCDVCNIKFPTEKSIILHKRMHLPVSKQKLIDAPVTYNSHGNMVSEETNEAFTCEICGKEYNTKYLEVHMKSHKEELLNCSICNRKFPDKDALSMHLQAHGNEVEKKISCSLCKKTFSQKKSLDDHIQNNCEKRKYSCSFCGRRFTKPHEKVKHERIHTGQKPHVCEICGKAFRVSYCLTLHMRTHSNIRPYQCQICNKRFKSHGAYRHHNQIHSDVRSYQCPFCPKAFKTAVQLAGHKNTHTKPFSCSTCSRPFASLYAVRLHMKSHDNKGEFKHRCHVCGAEYARYTALRDHMGTHPECIEEVIVESSPKKIKKVKLKVENPD
ncbi:zinc finger protein 2-like [Coccinella septempunctata]|uniref:zinc finger protein 2-like n=1 Tax=Coccinella septempunctata TaxID=41139 RepID=UPI001D09080D|nr:zinc finger protein 2-like [Coccinella septempunctata]